MTALPDEFIDTDSDVAWLDLGAVDLVPVLIPSIDVVNDDLIVLGEHQECLLDDLSCRVMAACALAGLTMVGNQPGVNGAVDAIEDVVGGYPGRRCSLASISTADNGANFVDDFFCCNFGHLSNIILYCAIVKIGDPGKIRTSDLCFRKAPLYPLSYGALLNSMRGPYSRSTPFSPTTIIS